MTKAKSFKVRGARGKQIPGVCRTTSLKYDFCKNRGEIFFPSGTCCDMSGCIAFFEQIDVDVLEIQTYSGVELDTKYVRDENGWKAFRVRRIVEPT